MKNLTQILSFFLGVPIVVTAQIIALTLVLSPQAEGEAPPGARASATFATNVRLRCESADRSVTIQGSLPAAEFQSELTVIVNSRPVTFAQNFSEDEITGDGVALVASPDQGIFTVSALGRGPLARKSFELVAHPQSITELSSRLQFTFTANYSVFNTNLPCTGGCIILSVEAEEESSPVESQGVVTCRASYRF